MSLTLGQLDAIAATQAPAVLFRCKTCGHVEAKEPIYIDHGWIPRCHRPMTAPQQIGGFSISYSEFCGEYERIDGGD